MEPRIEFVRAEHEYRRERLARELRGSTRLFGRGRKTRYDGSATTPDRGHVV